jgi:hypothetical protein
MALIAEKRGIYLNSEMHSLCVENCHFDLRDEFDAALRVGKVNESIERRMYVNFCTAVGEDVLRRGNFELEVCEGEKGRQILTTEDHREFGDITWITLKGAKKRRAEGKSYRRELAELVGMRKLRRNLLGCSDGSTFVLIYPPGSKEDGYSGVSLTYIYHVKDEEEKRKVQVEFYKNALSLGGHLGFVKIANPYVFSEPTELSPEFFVSQPIDISDSPAMQIADDVIGMIDMIANSDERFVSKGVGVGSDLAPEMFATYKPQIRESAAFLTKVLEEKLRFHPLGLDQNGLSELELAYSFARRAVSAFASNGQLISRELLDRDYQQQLYYSESKDLRYFDDYGLKSEVYFEASQFQHSLISRYGDIEERRVGGFGCPGGSLASIGFSMDGFTIPTFDGVEFSNSSEETWSYHLDHCVICDPKKERAKKLCGPCCICKDCERRLGRDNVS